VIVMTLKITCPSCQHSMLLKSYKPGKFKPKCSACGIVFSLSISSDQPPTVISKRMEQTLAGDPQATALDISRAPLKTDSNLSKPNTVGGSFGQQPKGVSSRSSASASKSDPRLTIPKVTGQKSPSPIEPTPKKLGGYRIVKVLGEGGMGAVYLAKQISLDRSVALKTIQPQSATSPRVIARFIREAYAAAQLTHHNVVQIYDLGEDAGVNFFSMELVGGGSLEDLMKQKGAIPSKTASMLILQAARGLKFAHDHGMIHRDVKPANLMLTNDGMLKVADLGLVKTPTMEDSVNEISPEDQNLMLSSARTSVTLQGSTMGTPAYMSPEQADDASSVDHRADIYSLGCTYYALLTGRPPFVSDTIIEILSKHKIEKIPRPESIVNNVPGVLGDIIDKMTAKRPEDRYQDLQHVIYDIEVFLGLMDPDDSEYRAATYSGIRRAGNHTSSPSETTSVPVSQILDQQAPLSNGTGSVLTSENESQSRIGAGEQTITIEPIRTLATANEHEIASLGTAAKEYARSPLRFVKQLLPTAFMSICLIFAFLFLLTFYSVALFFLAIAVSAFAGSILAGYFRHRSPLALRIRQLLKSNSVSDWIYQFIGVLLVAVAMYLLGLWGTLLIGCVLGVGVGVGYFYGIEEPLRKSRVANVQSIESVLKQMRLRGLSEDSIRIALLQTGGSCQESIVESVFGYDAMRQLIQTPSQNTSTSKSMTWSRYACFTDRVRNYWIQRIDTILEAARKRADQRILSKTERASLMASGVSAAEATRKAIEAAEGLVEAASETKHALSELGWADLSKEDADVRRARIKRMLMEARSGKTPKASVTKGSLEILLRQALGGKLRFALGAFLLVGFSLWVQQNELVSEQAMSKVQELRMNAVTTTDSARDKANSVIQGTAQLGTAILGTDTKPLNWPIIGGFFNGVAPAWAGLMLIVSSLAGGWLLSISILPAVFIILVGPSIGVPEVGEWVSSQSLSIAIGTVVAVIGYWFTPNR